MKRTIVTGIIMSICFLLFACGHIDKEGFRRGMAEYYSSGAYERDLQRSIEETNRQRQEDWERFQREVERQQMEERIRRLEEEQWRLRNGR